MTIIAQPYAGPQVHILVNNLNRMLFDSPSSAPKLKGLKLSKAREALMAKSMAPWHKSAEAALKEQPLSRQALRRMKRVRTKSLRSRQKVEAMRQYLPGGAAAV